MSDLSIFSVSGWDPSTIYNKNDIVLYGNPQKYYYSLTEINQNNTPTFATNNYWGGYRTYGNLTKPDFFWKPSYSTQLGLKPFVNVVRFGNGYEQRVPDGINTSNLKFDLVFEGRDKGETRAITHFLHKRKGSEGFFYDAPFPYNYDASQPYPKRFFCEEWNITYNFYNNYNINVKITETSNL